MPTNGANHRVLSKDIVRIYIDNSNLWIQGQKTYAEKKGLDVGWDPTWRFDIGRLKNILTRESGIPPDEMCFDIHLYGSTPPPVDTVWKAIEFHKVAVHTSARSTWTGREKEVDNKLGLDSVEQATEDSFRMERSEYMIVSGDRDLRPAVEKIVKRGFRVHVWSWKNSLSNVYKEMAHDSVRVHLLDDYLEEIGFRETTFRVDRNTISQDSIVVLDPLPKADEIQDLVSKLRVPVYQYTCVTKRADASSQDLVIIPAFARSMQHDELVYLFEKVKAKLEPVGLTVLTYLDYTQRFFENSPVDKLEISNQFEELLQAGESSHDGSQKGEHDGSIAGDESAGFTRVSSRAERQLQYLKNDERKSRILCCWGKYCKKAENCTFGHSDSDIRHFKTYGPKSAKKYRRCERANCHYQRNCHFAHSDAELLCTTCDQVGAGHGTDDCPRRGSRT